MSGVLDDGSVGGDAGVYCRAALHYSTATDDAPREVDIRDGRQGAPGLAEAGFALLHHASAVEDWLDEAHLASVHEPEVRDLALAMVGCDAAIVYPPIVRSPETARRFEDYAPIQFVHSDFTDDYRAMVLGAERAYAGFLAPALDAAGLGRPDLERATRIVMLQFWRNVGAPFPDFPLAFCDARTVPRAQLRAVPVEEYGGRRLEFETFAVEPPAAAQDNAWYTFPGLRPDEVVALRTYDSLLADTGGHFWTPHTAFADPRVGAGAPRRESVEMRVLCLWGI